MTDNENVVITLDPREKKEKTLKGFIAFFIIFIIVAVGSLGGLYHCGFKPMLEQMLEIVANVKDGENGINGTNGKDGYTPYIGTNGNWWINEQDTGIQATGSQGNDGEVGQDGLTPYIGDNGHWFIGEVDTGYVAGVNADLIPTNPLYEYSYTGNCEEGGFERYIDEHGSAVVLEYQAGEHKWDDTTHTCLRDATQLVFRTEDYQMAICCNTVCIWPLTDDAMLGLESGDSFNKLFTALDVEVKKVIIKEGITRIAYNAFRDCEYLEEVDLPSGLKSIGSHAFDGTNITDFYIPGTVTSMGEDCLNPYKVETITTLKNEVNPDQRTYLSCICNHYIDMDEESETYGQEKWQNMNYYKTNGKYANLRKVECLGKATIGYMGFRGCEALEEVIFHDETVISSWAFQGCISLEYVDLTGVISLGEVAFQCCESLTELYIPSTLVTMQKWVFDGSCNLTDIYIEAESKPTGWHNEWPGTINFCYTPKTPTAANWSRYFDNTPTTIHWGCSEENPDGLTTESHN